jgi:non-ribosomal peptide synthetase component E (peptide arylation enzyme)
MPFSPRMDAAAVPVRSDQETGWTTNSIVAAVLVQARQQPGRVAILLEDQAISYSRLCVDIERFARGMRMRAVLGGKQLPVPLGDDLDGAVGHLHRGLIIDRVRWHG